MQLHELTPSHTNKKARRVGRGISAGQGKTAGRGTKGQLSRAGANSNIPRTFEGGSTSLIQRLPKLKGFKSRRLKPVTLSYTRLVSVFEENETVDLASLIEKGLIKAKESSQGVKIVGGQMPAQKKLTFSKEDSGLKFSNQLSSKL